MGEENILNEPVCLQGWDAGLDGCFLEVSRLRGFRLKVEVCGATAWNAAFTAHRIQKAGTCDESWRKPLCTFNKNICACIFATRAQEVAASFCVHRFLSNPSYCGSPC